MKSRNLLGLCSLLALFSACGNGAPKQDATGTFETTEVLAVEKTEDNSEILLKVYEKNDHTSAIKHMMECRIDLKQKDVDAKSKDTYIYNPEESVITDEYRELIKQLYGMEVELDG